PAPRTAARDQERCVPVRSTRSTTLGVDACVGSMPSRPTSAPRTDRCCRCTSQGVEWYQSSVPFEKYLVQRARRDQHQAAQRFGDRVRAQQHVAVVLGEDLFERLLSDAPLDDLTDLVAVGVTADEAHARARPHALDVLEVADFGAIDGEDEAEL